MTHMCGLCGDPIKEGDKVQCAVRATYHRLKSKVAYALDREDLDAIPESLVHVWCIDNVLDPEDDEEEGVNN